VAAGHDVPGGRSCDESSSVSAAWRRSAPARCSPAKPPRSPPSRPGGPAAGIAETRGPEVPGGGSVATGAAESAAEAAQAAGKAAEAAEELSGEAASLLTALGFVDDRDVVQVLNIKLGTRVTFVPATIVVTAGSGRKLSIFNDTDMPHGFRIPGLALEVLLPPGRETLVELPPLVGPQSTRSSVTCTCRTGTRRWSCSSRPSGD
jgi:hypothetical protein